MDVRQKTTRTVLRQVTLMDHAPHVLAYTKNGMGHVSRCPLQFLVLFSLQKKYLNLVTIVLSFVLGKYCPTMD